MTNPLDPRETRTDISAMAGCFVCHGNDACWFKKNALAIAARHHDATGHPTWCEQTLFVHYGDRASIKEPDHG